MDQLARDGRRAAMATLVRVSGTTPRKEGTKMFVGAGGSIYGSVTIGGCVDARVIERSEEVLASESPLLLNLQLGDEEAWEIGLTCGGAVDVLVEPLTPPTIDLYERARSEAASGRPVGIATVISGPQRGERFLLKEEDGIALTTSRVVSQEGREIFVEVVRQPAHVVIFGAGAVAIPLVAIARTLGFRTTIIDGRARFANRERFAEADEVRVGIPSAIAEEMHFGPTTPVVLVAHDYKIDIPVLKRALASDVPYIGLLGSRKRGAAIKQMLREDGVAEEQLQRIRVPVGLDLGGESAAEIALSIASEIVAVVHGRNGSPLSQR